MHATPHPSQPEQPEAATLHLVNSREDIERAEHALISALERFRYPDAARFAVRLAMEEALVNAFRHGHKNLPASETVRFQYSVSAGEVVLEVEDKGPGFDPEGVRDPTLDENLELPTGRGLLLMRAYMTSVEYFGRGNHVRMVFHPKPVSKS
jgi:serine/threonine-protein kinase RsbW